MKFMVNSQSGFIFPLVQLDGSVAATLLSLSPAACLLHDTDTKAQARANTYLHNVWSSQTWLTRSKAQFWSRQPGPSCWELPLVLSVRLETCLSFSMCIITTVSGITAFSVPVLQHTHRVHEPFASEGCSPSCCCEVGKETSPHLLQQRRRQHWSASSGTTFSGV